MSVLDSREILGLQTFAVTGASMRDTSAVATRPPAIAKVFACTGED